MSAATCNCVQHVNWLTQQVSVMRKEINNLRQRMESTVRAHRKQMASLQSLLTDGPSEKKQRMMKASPSSPRVTGSEVSLERGRILTEPVGFIDSCFSQKNGTPRQPAVCRSSRASLRIRTSVFNNPEHALIGLHQYSHVWLIFVFHKNGHMTSKAKVKPPRLNGQKVGVYSTRSPHRPNAIGLTLAKLEGIVGNTLNLSGVDLISGTPVLDIKPYVPQYDSPLTLPTDQPRDQRDQQEEEEEEEEEELLLRSERSERSCDPRVTENSPDRDWSRVLTQVREYLQQGVLFTEQKSTHTAARDDDDDDDDEEGQADEENSSIADWIRNPPVGRLSVRFTPTAERELTQFSSAQNSDSGGIKFQFLKGPDEAAAAIRAVLAADPRSVYRRQRCADRLFFFSLDTAHITCWFGDGFAEVLRVRPVRSDGSGAALSLDKS